MSLPPLDPEKSASGIILDPRTLERVVPTSKRSDGTLRKELKIRPGFTPQEDIGRFRSTRQSAQDARKGFVPGSNRAPAKAVDTENPFAQEPKEKTKAQSKNEKRREKKRTEAESKDWDEDEDEVEGGDASHASAPEKLEKQAGGAGGDGAGTDGPIPSEQAFPPFGSHGTPPPPPVQEDPQGSTIPASQPSDQPSTQNGVDIPTPPPAASETPSSGTELPPPSTSTASSSTSRPPPKVETKAGQKRHPIQGGRDGPIGLAHPPPIEKTKSEKAANWRKEPGQKAPTTAGAVGGKGRGGAKPGTGAGAGAGAGAGVKTNGQTPQTEPKPAAAEPRVRKEVKIRQGHNDVGSLANRVRSMVLENQNTSPRGKKEATPEP